jgi:hypothetical protein
VGEPGASGPELEPDVGKLPLLHSDAVLKPAQALLEVADSPLESLDPGGVGLDRGPQLTGLVLMGLVTARQVGAAGSREQRCCDDRRDCLQRNDRRDTTSFDRPASQTAREATRDRGAEASRPGS